MLKNPKVRRIGVFFLAFLGVSSLAHRRLSAAPVVPQDPGLADDPPFSYYFEGRLVVLEASPDLIALRGEAPAPPAEAGLRWRRDRLSDRGAVRDTGYAVYRLGPDAPDKTPLKASRPTALAVAREAGVAAQPVFELGGAVKIPSDEVIVAFAGPTDLGRAQAELGARSDLGVVGVRPFMENTFVATISDAAGGRVFAVSRELSGAPGVAYAEPNFVVVMHPERPAIGARPPAWVAEEAGGPAKPMIVEGARAADAGPVEPLGLRERRGKDDPSAPVGWSQVLYETFELGAPGWTFHPLTVRPVITNYRSVAGTRSAYMTGGGSGGVPPPGPYPINALAQLSSPAMNLAGFEEVYVELWFFARYENPGASYYDYALVFLLQGASSVLMEPLVVPYTGDLAADPTTLNGWRHLIFRVPPAWRVNGVQIGIQFSSDFSIGAEGVYVDEVWVGGTLDVDTGAISNDAYSARQYELKNSGQIAAYGDDTNDLNVPEAWAAQPVSPGVVLAIVDDGVEPHGDLSLVTGYNGATGGAGGGPTSAEAAHGQACAGNAGAIRNNGAGVAGTAAGVKIMPVNYGSTDANVATAINLAVAGGAKVLSNSWGYVGAPSATIQTAIVNALNAGRTVLFAAGNGPDRPPFTYDTAFPCNLTATTSVICVGATGPLDDHKGASSSDGLHFWGSSYVGAGPDVMAPGPWSYSTDRLGSLGYNASAATTGIDVNYTHDFGGTSSSTPKAAGVAALVLSANPALTPAQVKSILQTTAEDIDSAGVDDRTGYGRLDALAAVTAAQPRLSINDVAVAEGGVGATSELTFTVSLSAPSGQAVTVTYATLNGTAIVNSDYLANSGTLNLPAGTTSKPISVTILGDAVNEGNETFGVALLTAVGAVILDNTGVGTINNDDSAGFSIDDVAVVEPAAGTTTAVFTVTLAPPAAATVNFATADGTATAGGDYVMTNGTLVFTAGTPTQTVSVTVNADALAEGLETFLVNLSSSSGPALVRAQGTGRISDRGFYTIAPCRLVDTRLAGQGAPALTVNVDRVFALGNKCGLPATATALSLNLAVTGTTGNGNLRLWKAGTAMPTVSAINWSAGQTRANNAIVPLSASGQAAVRAQGGAGFVDLILDVNGYFQ